MPYDTKHIFEETTGQHAVRLRQSERWTKIRRRALLLKLDGLTPDEVQARMGITNCPDYLARASVDDLMQELAVVRQGTTLAAAHGREPSHALAAIQDMARDLGLNVTIPDLTRDLAGDSNKLALAQAGVLLGHSPYGYKRDGTQEVTVGGEPQAVARIAVHPRGQEAVVLLFQRYTVGQSFPEIAAELNRQGHRARSGAPLNPETLRDMLRNPVYAGYVLYRGVEDRNRREAGTLYPGLHPAIVSWETFCQAQDARVRRDPRDPKPFWQCPWENAPQRERGRR